MSRFPYLRGTREEKIAALRAMAERQFAARKKAEQDIVDIDAALRETLAEFMDLVVASPSDAKEGK